MQKVEFKSGDLTIRATLVATSGLSRPAPAVITFHGMTSSEKGYMPLASLLSTQGIACLTVNIRGHGRSEGDFATETVEGAVNDAIAAYDFLVSQPGIDKSQVGVVGTSVGAILAALLSTQRPVASIVFRAPAAYTKRMMQLSMAATMTNENRQFHEIDNLADTPAGKAIEDFQGDLLVIASENDTIIPLSVSQGYIDIAKKSKSKKLTVIKGATHGLTNPAWKKTFIDSAVEWFTNKLL